MNTSVATVRRWRFLDQSVVGTSDAKTDANFRLRIRTATSSTDATMNAVNATGNCSTTSGDTTTWRRVAVLPIPASPSVAGPTEATVNSKATDPDLRFQLLFLLKMLIEL